VNVDHLIAGLDPQQIDAVTSTASPLAIVAAAGSGKTTVLTRRIAHRVATGTADTRHVLALTFTREAASELRRRLYRLELREPVDTGTFHSVALRLLRDRALANHQTPPQVSNDRVGLLRTVLQELRLKADPGSVAGASADIDWARARLIAPADFSGIARLHRRRTTIPANRYGDVVQAYEQLKRRRGVLDFDDLLADLLTAMSTDRNWAEGVRWRYRHLFVDEAQDLNPLQHAVLESIRDGRPDLCLVGDPRQAIYGWNGADHALLAEVQRTYPGIHVLELSTNYRCSPHVVAAGAAALTAAGQHDTSFAARPPAGTVRIETFGDADEEAAGVATIVATLLARHSAQQVAVLCRTNEQAAVLHAALTARGIAAERSAGKSPLDRALATPYRCRNREQLAEWVERAFHDTDDLVRRVAAEADRYLTSGETGTFRAWVDERTPFDDLDPGTDDGAVTVLTFHAAKGREWGAVVVAGVEDHLVPHSSATSADQLAEEARLFYVALTRAGDDLIITSAATRNGRASNPSRWLSAVASSTIAPVDDVAPEPTRIPTAPTDVMLPLREWRAAVARGAGVSPRDFCSDRVLRSLHDEPPADAAALAARLGLTESAAARLRPLPDRSPDR
jgi:DNA helicase-2/ATP-dependent DNA helicase PcrA